MEITIGRRSNGKIPISLTNKEIELNLEIKGEEISETYTSLRDALIELNRQRYQSYKDLIIDIAEFCTDKEVTEIINQLKNDWEIE